MSSFAPRSITRARRPGLVHLDLCAREGAQAILGTHAERARRIVGATFGWRALWAACKASGRVGRFWSSRRSIL